MSNELYFLLSTLVLLSISTVVLRLFPAYTIPLIGTLMVGISTCGAAEIKVLGLHSNTGNIFYGTVMYLTSMQVLMAGRERVIKSIKKVFFVLICLQLLFWILWINPHPVPLFLGVVVNSSANIVAASFLAFVISQACCVFLVERLKGFAIPSILAQVVDSAIFFPIAFYGKIGSVFDFAIDGLKIKIVVALLAWPFGASIIKKRSTA